MCPFRVLIIFLSAAIAIFATMAAMAKDPTEEELEAERIKNANQPQKTAWRKFVYFWTGKYLYDETRRLFPIFFSKEQPEIIEDEAVAEDIVSGGSVRLSDAIASLPVASAPSLSPSAPESDDFELVSRESLSSDEDGVEAPGGASTAKVHQRRQQVENNPAAIAASIS